MFWSPSAEKSFSVASLPTEYLAAPVCDRASLYTLSLTVFLACCWIILQPSVDFSNSLPLHVHFLGVDYIALHLPTPMPCVWPGPFHLVNFHTSCKPAINDIFLWSLILLCTFLHQMHLYDCIMNIINLLFVVSLEPSSGPGVYQMLCKYDLIKWLCPELME